MTKIVSRFRSAYLNGRIIKEEDFQVLDDMIKKVSEIENKEDYLKKKISVDKYLTMDLEQFEVLSKENSIMKTLLIDLEDIFDCILNDSDEVFSSVEDAKRQLVLTLKKISELKEEYNEYFNEEL